MNAKRIGMIILIIVLGFICGRLFIRFIGNLLLGGTMFGGNLL